MTRTLTTLATICTFVVLCACGTSGGSGAKCNASGDKVGMTTGFASTTVEPGKTLEVSSNQLVCNGQCPVTGHAWTVTPKASASGTLTVTYGAHCGPSNGPFSSDTIGTCKLLFSGTTALTDAALADSRSADCVALWAGVKPDDPADTKPCSAGSTNNFMPYVTFFNNGTAAVTVTGPGPASNPTANCTYVSTN